ncbi:hypothetical protein Tco_0867481 [Tanacetum coccineum]
MEVTTQAANIKDLKAQIKQLKKKARPVINHHKAWMKSLLMKKRLARKKKMESVSKQERKTFKSEPTVHKDPTFDDLDDAMDYMETEDAHDEGTLKDSEEKRVNTEDQPNEGTAEPKDENSNESVAPRTVLNAELEGVNEVERKFAQLANDEEVVRKVQEEWEAEEEKKLAEEEATKLHSPMSMTIFRKDSMQMRFFLKNFKKKREKSSPLNREPSCFMTQLMYKGDFLLNKDLRLLETNFLKKSAEKPNDDIFKACRQKKFDQSFIPIDSAEDERQIREMNKKTAETDTSKKRKSGSRVKRIFKKRKTDSDVEEKEKLKSFLNVEPDEDKAINYEVLQTRFLFSYISTLPQFYTLELLTN